MLDLNLFGHHKSEASIGMLLHDSVARIFSAAIDAEDPHCSEFNSRKAGYRLSAVSFRPVSFSALTILRTGRTPSADRRQPFYMPLVDTPFTSDLACSYSA